MSTPEEVWTTRLHAAVDDHPGALEFDVRSYVAAGRHRVRRRRAAAVLATAAAVAVVAAVGGVGTRDEASQPAAPLVPSPTTLGAGTNGWVAVDGHLGGDDIYLVRPGEEVRRLEVVRSDATDEACPAWSPDGTRLLFGRVVGGSLGSSPTDPELVIVPVGQNGAPGTPAVMRLDGFEVGDGFDAHPCGTWAPNGRWVAFAGTGQVWVVDVQTGAVRHLPDLRPSDLEWRPGTDELAIAGDMGTNRDDPTVSTPVSVYSVTTGELRTLGSAKAAAITWSPDGATLAYTGGETDRSELRLVDADGANERLLVADSGNVGDGIGPVWSPTGDRIAYQRRTTTGGELPEVALVNVADGSETVIEPPELDGRFWYPFHVSWSPDGTTLLYAAWTEDSRSVRTGLIAVPADLPSNATVLTHSIDPSAIYSHRWTPNQTWGRQPG